MDCYHYLLIFNSEVLTMETDKMFLSKKPEFGELPIAKPESQFPSRRSQRFFLKGRAIGKLVCLKGNPYQNPKP